MCVCVQVLKLLAEMSPFCGDMDKLEANLNMLFSKLLVRKRLGPRNSTEACHRCWIGEPGVAPKDPHPPV